MGKSSKHASTSFKGMRNKKKDDQHYHHSSFPNNRPNYNNDDNISDNDNDQDPFERQQGKILFDTKGHYSSESEFSDESVMNIIPDQSDGYSDNDKDAEAFSDNEDDNNYKSNDSNSEEEEQEEKWGKNKKVFYSADKNELDDEYQEVCHLQKKKSASLGLDNFFKNKSTPSLFGKIESSVIQLDQSEDEDPSFPDMNASDIKSKIESLALKDSEIKKLYDELEVLLDQLNNHLKPLITKITEQNQGHDQGQNKNKEDKDKDKEINNNHTTANGEGGLDFLQVKCQLLAGYCANIGYYLWIRANGASTKGHKIMRQLARYRLLLEKMKPVEAKLQYQIDKLVQASSHVSSGDYDPNKIAQDPLSYRPNIEEMDRRDLFEQQKRFGIGAAVTTLKMTGNNENDNIYRAPKIAPMHYPHDDVDADGNSSHQLSKKHHYKRLTKIEKDIQDDILNIPEETHFDSIYKGDDVDTFAAKSTKSVQEYEEENFIRFNLSRKEKNKAMRLEEKPIDELDELDAYMNEMEEHLSKNSNSKKEEKKNQNKRKEQQQQEGSEKKSSNKNKLGSSLRSSTLDNDEYDEEDDDMNDNNFPLSDESEIEDDDDRNHRSRSSSSFNSSKKFKNNNNNNVEMERERERKKQGRGNKFDSSFINKKHQLSHRKLIDMNNIHDKRPINRDIMKNRGLILNHRTKYQRNPRVKQRHRFEKAQKRLVGFKPIVAESQPARYGGERTGIRSNLSRSTKF